MITEKLPDFPGFGVRYETSSNPFFKPIMIENLRKIQECDLGKQLLKLIGDAKPASRADFPGGINVMCMPHAYVYTQAGFKKDVVYGDGGKKTVLGITKSDDPKYAPKGCPFYGGDSSFNKCIDIMSAGNGQGTVCEMHFSNAQIMTSKGEKTVPFVVLAHELIHSYHGLYGIRKDTGEEEWTTGIGAFEGEPISENAFRSQMNMQPRKDY